MKSVFLCASLFCVRMVGAIRIEEDEVGKIVGGYEANETLNETVAGRKPQGTAACCWRDSKTICGRNESYTCASGCITTRDFTRDLSEASCKRKCSDCKLAFDCSDSSPAWNGKSFDDSSKQWVSRCRGGTNNRRSVCVAWQRELDLSWHYSHNPCSEKGESPCSWNGCCWPTTTWKWSGKTWDPSGKTWAGNGVSDETCLNPTKYDSPGYWKYNWVGNFNQNAKHVEHLKCQHGMTDFGKKNNGIGCIFDVCKKR